MQKMILGCILFAAVSFVSVAPWASDVLSLKDGHPQTYVVMKGDTLWDISAIFLNDPWLWPEIWPVNSQMDNSHLIYPGDILNLVYIDGKPRLVVKGNNAVKLSPKVHISELDLAIPAITLDAVSPFLSHSRVVSKEKLQNAAYVLAGADGHMLSGAGDQLFARGEFDPEGEKNFGIFRFGDVYIDPDTEELLGYQALSIASAKVIDIQKDIATMGVNRATAEVRRGDRLLPYEQHNIRSNFYPDAPVEETDGYIIAVEGGVSQIGSMNVVVINKGEREGLQVGHVLAIYRAGERVRDSITGEIVEMPGPRAGLMMVFRTFEKVSYGLVLKATRPLAVMDKVKTP